MNVKKLLLTNLPYLLFVYPFDKVSQAFRLAPARTTPASSYPSWTVLPLFFPGWG